MAIDKKLVYFKKKANYTTEVSNGLPTTSICFIEDTSEIITHGNVFLTNGISDIAFVSSTDANHANQLAITKKGTTTYLTVPYATTAGSVDWANTGHPTFATVATSGSYNDLSNKPTIISIGTTSTTAAAGDHTHTTSLAADSGTSSISLSANTKYKLTAGGTSVIFTTPSDNNTWKAATTSQEGYVPLLALATTDTITTQASEYVLTYKSGTETAPVWRKLPANAFNYEANTDTKVTTEVTTSKMYLIGKSDANKAATSTALYDASVYVTSGTLTATNMNAYNGYLLTTNGNNSILIKILNNTWSEFDSTLPIYINKEIALDGNFRPFVSSYYTCGNVSYRWSNVYTDSINSLISLDSTNNRVGIGNTAPSYALDVTGVISASQGYTGTHVVSTDSTSTSATVTITDSNLVHIYVYESNLTSLIIRNPDVLNKNEVLIYFSSGSSATLLSMQAETGHSTSYKYVQDMTIAANTSYVLSILYGVFVLAKVITA